MVKGMKPSLELTLLQYHVFTCLYMAMKTVLSDERYRIKLSSTKIRNELKEKNIYTVLEAHHVANALRELKGIGLIRQIEDVLRTEGSRGGKPEATWELNESLFEAHTIVVVQKFTPHPSTAIANPTYKHPQVVPAKKPTDEKPTGAGKKKKKRKVKAKGEKNTRQSKKQQSPKKTMPIAELDLGTKISEKEILLSKKEQRVSKLQNDLVDIQKELQKLKEEIEPLKEEIVEGKKIAESIIKYMSK